MPRAEPLGVASRLSRRAVLRAAVSAGVGAAAIALAGCGEDAEDAATQPPGPQAVEPPPPDPPTAQVAANQGADAPSARSQPVDQPQPQPVQRPGNRSAAASRATAATTARLVPVRERIVDPVGWRERYHWRKLEELHSTWNGRRAPAAGGTLTIESKAVPNWDPFAAWNPEADRAQPGHLLPLVYRRLIGLAVNDHENVHRTELAGDLSQTPEIPDLENWVFPLNPGIVWPEGPLGDERPLQAEDVLLSYEAMRAAGRRQAQVYEGLDRIEVEYNSKFYRDAPAIWFRLREPGLPLLYHMTSPWHVVLPAEVASGEQPIDLSQQTVGNGPFVLSQSDGFSGWVLTRNQSYRYVPSFGDPYPNEERPFLDEVHGVDYGYQDQVGDLSPGSAKWSAWERGEAHSIEIESVVDARQALDIWPDAQLQVTPPTPSGGPHFTFRSLYEGPFADVRVRAALSMAVHRRNLAILAYFDLAAPDAAHNWTWFPDKRKAPYYREWPWDEDELGETQQYDPGKARTLLQAAGYSEAAPLQIRVDMPPVSNPFGRPPDARMRSIADFVADQWEQHLFGLATVERLTRSWASVTNTAGRQGHRPLPDPAADLLFQDPADVEIYDVDPDDLAYGSLHSAGRFNRAGVNDPEVDALTLAQRRETEGAEPLERLRLLEQQLVWRILLVNPYGVHVRREQVFNLVDTYYAKRLELAPDQLKSVWIDARP